MSNALDRIAEQAQKRRDERYAEYLRLLDTMDMDHATDEEVNSLDMLIDILGLTPEKAREDYQAIRQARQWTKKAAEIAKLKADYQKAYDAHVAACAASAAAIQEHKAKVLDCIDAKALAHGEQSRAEKARRSLKDWIESEANMAKVLKITLP